MKLVLGVLDVVLFMACMFLIYGDFSKIRLRYLDPSVTY